MKQSLIACLCALCAFQFFSGCATGPHVQQAEQGTFARFVPERSDDFAWENDLIAFRAYGPALRSSSEDSGFDCWLKRVPYPIINKWYAEHEQGKSYHTDHGEGYDPYKVGGSRGCGGLALWLNEQLITSNVFTGWEIVKSSREETVFVLNYEWTHNGDIYTEAKQISIRLGERLFESTSTFTKNGQPAADLPIAIGLVRHDPTNLVTKNLDEGWMAVWETIDGSGLGTGVVIEPSRIDAFRLHAGEGDSYEHALIITRTDADGRLEYHTGYGWERAGTITTLAQWKNYLAEFTENR